MASTRESTTFSVPGMARWFACQWPSGQTSNKKDIKLLERNVLIQGFNASTVLIISALACFIFASFAKAFLVGAVGIFLRLAVSDHVLGSKAVPVGIPAYADTTLFGTITIFKSVETLSSGKIPPHRSSFHQPPRSSQYPSQVRAQSLRSLEGKEDEDEKEPSPSTSDQSQQPPPSSTSSSSGTSAPSDSFVGRFLEVLRTPVPAPE